MSTSTILFILFAVAMVAMHLFGHGHRHGGGDQDHAGGAGGGHRGGCAGGHGHEDEKVGAPERSESEAQPPTGAPTAEPTARPPGDHVHA